MFLSWGFLPGSHCWASALGTAAFGSQALQLYIFVPYLHISIFVSSIWWDGGVLILMPPCHILSIVVIMLILWISPPVTGTRMVMIPWTDTTDTKNITEAPQTYAACAMPWGRPGELEQPSVWHLKFSQRNNKYAIRDTPWITAWNEF